MLKRTKKERKKEKEIYGRTAVHLSYRLGEGIATIDRYPDGAAHVLRLRPVAGSIGRASTSTICRHHARGLVVAMNIVEGEVRAAVAAIVFQYEDPGLTAIGRLIKPTLAAATPQWSLGRYPYNIWICRVNNNVRNVL